jgi:hypothetical protein
MLNLYNPDDFEPDPDTTHWNNVPQSGDLIAFHACEHDKATVDASLVKHINTDAPEINLGLQLVVAAKCAKCGAAFLLSDGFAKVHIPVRVQGAFYGPQTNWFSLN